MTKQDKRRATNKVSSAKAEAVPRRRARPRGLNEWQDLVTEKLDEAAARGAFDNLPGSGRPLRLNENPNEPSDMRMANKLLKDNDLTPAWIGDRRALQAEIEALRAAMRRQWDLTRAQARAPETEAEAPKKLLEAHAAPVASTDRRPEPAHR